MGTVQVSFSPAREIIYQSPHAFPAEEVVSALGVNPAVGLDTEEARRRLQQYGPNQLQELPRPGFLALLARQFKDFLVLMLIAASLISILLGEYIDAGAIIAIIVLNAVLGVVQESKAEEALAALKKMAAPEATALRNGHVVTLPAAELVPGDIAFLEAGDYVPADMRLLESVNLRIDEAPLTGESMAVEKNAAAVVEADAPLGDRRNMAFLGTVVTYGRGRGVVVATGMNTQIGRIAEMIQTFEEEETPLQRRLEQLGKMLGLAALAICAVVFALGVFEGKEPLEMFLVAVSLAVAAVPEGLPAVVTICLALGLQRMVRRNALVRRLPAVETLGSATAICSDKTGTLTQNKMTVVEVYADGLVAKITGTGYQPTGEFIVNERRIDPNLNPAFRKLLEAAVLCNDARLERADSPDEGWEVVGDPTEGALLVLAAKGGLWQEALLEEHRRLQEVPFDSARKRMITVHPNGHEGRFVVYVKGAPDILLELSTHILRDGRPVPLQQEEKELLLEQNRRMAAKALRVLGFAYRELDTLPEKPEPSELEKNLIFIGLVGMIDPARPEVKDAIALARRAGISTYMVTGDHKDTALAIARELGLLEEGDLVLDGNELNRMDDARLREIAPKVRVYARVSPEHKLKIVEALKAHGHIVAMTGDGVNDAPAVKRADIGVAMGITGTDVTKQTADMVLTDDNYSSIVAAIEEGRIIYSNIRKFVYYLLSCNAGEILVVFLATLFGWPVPLSPVQLLLINLLTDGAPALALGLEKGDPDIMERPPRRPGEPILNREMQIGVLTQAVAIAIATLTAYRLGMHWFPENLTMARTMAFATLTLSELFRAYTARSEYHFIFTIGVFSNKYMQYAVLASLAILGIIFYVPSLHKVFDTHSLTLGHWLDILPLAIIAAAVAEITKLLLRKRSMRQLAANAVRAGR